MHSHCFLACSSLPFTPWFHNSSMHQILLMHQKECSIQLTKHLSPAGTDWYRVILTGKWGPGHLQDTSSLLNREVPPTCVPTLGMHRANRDGPGCIFNCLCLFQSVPTTSCHLGFVPSKEQTKMGPDTKI